MEGLTPNLGDVITTVSGGLYSGVTFAVDSLTAVPEPGAPAVLVTAMVLSFLGLVKGRKKEGLNHGGVAATKVPWTWEFVQIRVIRGSPA